MLRQVPFLWSIFITKSTKRHHSDLFAMLNIWIGRADPWLRVFSMSIAYLNTYLFLLPTKYGRWTFSFFLTYTLLQWPWKCLVLHFFHINGALWKKVIKINCPLCSWAWHSKNDRHLIELEQKGSVWHVPHVPFLTSARSPLGCQKKPGKKEHDVLT